MEHIMTLLCGKYTIVKYVLFDFLRIGHIMGKYIMSLRCKWMTRKIH